MASPEVSYLTEEWGDPNDSVLDCSLADAAVLTVFAAGSGIAVETLL